MASNPAKKAFTVFRGSTFARRLVYRTLAADGVTKTPVNLTGYTAKMTIRKDYDGESAIDLTTENGRITLGGTAGTIALDITAADAAGLPVMTGVYDLELYASDANGVRTENKLLYGTFTVRQESTR